MATCCLQQNGNDADDRSRCDATDTAAAISVGSFARGHVPGQQGRQYGFQVAQKWAAFTPPARRRMMQAAIFVLLVDA
jgi:hypothetical protein